MTEQGFITKEHIKQIDADQAKFILEHAEKHLKETLDGNSLIVTRTTTLLTITVGFMTALIGFGITRSATNGVDAMAITAFIIMIYLYIVTLFLVDNIQPKTYITLGALPSDFFTENFFGKHIPDNERLKYIYINEVNSIEKRIKENKATNERRWKLFRRCLYFVTATPMALLIVYLIANAIVSRPSCLLVLLLHPC